MDQVSWILRRSHCRVTHHLFAIDALDFVQTSAGKRLASWLKRYHREYLIGAADPDVRICDFQNQIIHVEDGYWGGGPRVARQWYNRLLSNLQEQRYAEAARSAGILSHYFTDALQPLHTGQTRREALVHAPLERSLYHGYDEIRQHWMNNPLRDVFDLPSGPDWLRTSMLEGAKFAHGRFSLLVNSYCFDAGVADPSAGLNEVSRAALAELVGRTVTGWARVMERAAQDAENLLLRPLPVANGTTSLWLAAIRSPVAWWQRYRQHRLTDRQIELLAKEYRRKGYLRKYLPDEVDIKQRVNQVRRDEKIYQAGLAERARRRNAEQARSVPLRVQSIDGRLLNAAGFHGIEQVGRADAPHLHAQLLRVSLTAQGQRILRGQNAPTLDDVDALIGQIRADRAA